MHEMIQSIAGVNVIAEFTSEGKMIPLAIRWKTGRIYKIDKVTYNCDCVGVMSSKNAQRYLITIGSQQRHLFYEANGRWFIEDKKHVLEA